MKKSGKTLYSEDSKDRKYLHNLIITLLNEIKSGFIAADRLQNQLIDVKKNVDALISIVSDGKDKNPLVIRMALAEKSIESLNKFIEENSKDNREIKLEKTKGYYGIVIALVTSILALIGVVLNIIY